MLCTGYADAFLRYGKAIGLEVGYVDNDKHAWNMIKLDDQWYQVDVTFEDSGEDNNYNFGNLRNKYINLEDVEMSVANYHGDRFGKWTTNGYKATAITYGTPVVAQYMADGTTDTSLAKSYHDRKEAELSSYINNDKAKDITYQSEDAAVQALVAQLDRAIQNKEKNINLLVRYNDYSRKVDSRESKTVVSMNDTVIQKALTQLKAKYPDIITGANVSAQKPEADGSTKYVCRNTFTVSYKETAVTQPAAQTATAATATQTATAPKAASAAAAESTEPAAAKTTAARSVTLTALQKTEEDVAAAASEKTVTKDLENEENGNVEESAAKETEENVPTEEQKEEPQGETEEPENGTEPAETEPQKATSSNL